MSLAPKVILLDIELDLSRAFYHHACVVSTM